MPSMDELSADQQDALHRATANLTEEFSGIFGVETIEQFLVTSFRATSR
jgi:hypothetical protein